jgi:hypothetical protein
VGPLGRNPEHDQGRGQGVTPGSQHRFHEVS